jgi:hypothetical protein
MRILMVLVALSLGAIACHDGCDPEDTRCAGARVEVCASDGDWALVEDCAAVGPGAWACCEVALVWEGAETAGCVPVGECEGQEDGGSGPYAAACVVLVSAVTCYGADVAVDDCEDAAADGDADMLCALGCPGEATCAELRACVEACAENGGA